MSSGAPRVLVVDNRDSFTFNVVQALRAAGAATGVVDAHDPRGPWAGRLRIDGLVISPGPGRPADAGHSRALLEAWAGRIPVWGICLGHQLLAEARGARLRRSHTVLHGKTSSVLHDGRGLFSGIANPVEVMRYHSLVVDPESVPASLEVSARSEDGEIMGLRCRLTGAEGVQFHPESVLGAGLTPMFRTWVGRCRPAPLQAGEST